jgi:hypothetical protein
MMEYNKKEFSEKITILEKFLSDDNTRNIHLFGGFSSAKNEILTTALEKFQDEEKNDSVDLIIGAFASGIENIYEFIPLLTKNSEQFPNSYANLKRFDEILDILNQSHEDLFEATKFHLDLSNSVNIDDGNDDENNNINFYKSLSKILIRKSDLRMIECFPEVITESFIIDLLSIFYPNQSAETLVLNKENETKPKIILWIARTDNYFEKLNQLLLPTFQNYLNKKSFGEFISFDIDIEDKDFGPKDLLDIKIISSSRKRKINFDAELINCNEDLLSEDYSVESSRLFFQGVSEKPLNFEGSGDDYILKLRDDLFYPFPDEDAYLFLCSAYVSVVSKDSMGVFDQISSVEKVLNFTKTNSEYFYAKDNQIRILPFYEFLIKELISRTEPDLHEDLLLRANSFEGVKEIALVTGNDFDYIRNLAYFKNFDKENAISKAYLEDANTINSIIDSQQDLFSNNEFTLALNHRDRQKLMAYNKFVDGVKFAAKEEIIRSIWDATRNDFDVMLSEYRSEISKIKKQIEEISEKNEKLNEILEKLSTQLRKVENISIGLKSELSKYSKPKSERLVTGIFAFGLTLFVLSGLDFFEILNILSIFFKNDFIVIASGLLGIGLVTTMARGVFRILKYNKNEDKVKKMISELNDSSEISSETMTEINTVKADIEANSAKLSELSTDIANYNRTIGELGRKLSEPFY